MSSFLKKTTLLVLTAVFSLTALADEASVKKAIGESCSADTNCQAAKCLLSSVAPTEKTGVCSVQCSAASDCPAPSTCVKQQCQLPLAVGVAATTECPARMWSVARA